MQKKTPEGWLGKWKWCKWSGSERNMGLNRFKCIQCPILCNSPAVNTLRKRGVVLWLGHSHSVKGTMGSVEEGSFEGACRALGTELTQWSETFIQPGQHRREERNGISTTGCKKGPHCPLSLFQEPQGKMRPLCSLLVSTLTFQCLHNYSGNPLYIVLLTILLMDT